MREKNDEKFVLVEFIRNQRFKFLDEEDQVVELEWVMTRNRGLSQVS